MKTGVNQAVIITLAMAAVIFLCRIFPFLFFGKNTDTAANTADAANRGAAEKRRAVFLSFVEKTVPPVAMTVLAFNALAGPVKTGIGELVPSLAAGIFTAGIHLWKRNPLISIFGGTILYIVLIRLTLNPSP